MALWCLDPFKPYVVGQRAMDARTKRVHDREIPCGRCKACLANRKQDWTGRLVAEGLESAAVMFLTLTYAEEPTEFRYSDVQTFLKGLRKNVARKWPGCKVRFFCAGERGDINGRIHWHLMLFFSKSVFIRARKAGEKWSLWDRGWAAIDMIPRSDTDRLVKKCRYCVMYCLKGIDGSDTPNARCSLGTSGDGPLGAAYFTKLATEVANNGAMPDGKYRFPQIRYDRGARKGQMQSFTLRGASRDWFIAKWREAWNARYPERANWCNDWLLRYDRQDADHSAWQRGETYAATPGILVHNGVHLAHRVTPSGNDWVSRWLVGKGWAVRVEVSPTNAVGRIVSDDDREWWFDYSISELLDIDQATIDSVDEWARISRGPQWKGREFDGESREADKAAAAERRESIAQHARDEIVRRREKYGVHPTAPGIYRTAFLAEYDGQIAGSGNRSLRENLALQGCYLSAEDNEGRIA